MKKDNKIVRFLYDIVLDLVGCFIYAVGLKVFIVPNQVAQGGATGVAILINYLTGVPIGVANFFIINIPLLLVAYKIIGKKFTVNTIRTSFVLAIMVDYFYIFNIPEYKGLQLLAAIFGGILIGMGLGFAFLHDSTTGGMDIVARLAQKKFEHFPIGRLLLAMDFMVLTASVIVFKNIESGLVGVIGIFVSSNVVDMIVYGVDKGKIVYVFSEKCEEISKDIIRDMHRGATLIKSIGAYTGDDRLTLMCVVRKAQYPTVKRIVRSIDPSAMIVVSDANEVLGEGFRKIEEQD